MAINIKPVASIVAKYVQNAGAAGQSYKDGVNNPKQDWATATGAADQTWASGVQAAVGNGSFKKGVTAAGSQKWQSRANTVGALRYPQGIQAGQQNYQTKITNVLNVLQGLNLPPRFPKGDPGNINRVAAVDTALRQAKLNGQL
jgi:hypothetical protein